MVNRVGLLIFDDVDLLDVGGPYEVFLTAGRLRMREGSPEPFEVFTIGPGPATAYGGLTLVPHTTVEGAGVLDLLVVPGAITIDEVAETPAVISAVRTLAPSARVVASVCTGAFLLARAGLLPGNWTTHWEDIDLLSGRAGSPGGVRARWVDTGTVVTGGGLSSGIAMALHLVERMEDRDLAVRTARQIDYPWDPDDGIVSDGSVL